MSRYLHLSILLFAVLITLVYSDEKRKTCADFGSFEECKQYLKNKADEERNKRREDFEERQKTTTTTVATTTTTKPTTTTAAKTADDLLMECCSEHKDIAAGCYGYCKYSQITTNTLTQMYSNAVCRPGMKTWFNCASREMDHAACCAQAAVDKAPGNPICMNLCQSTIASVTINASYLPCLYLIDRVGRCFQQDVQAALDNGDI